MKIMTVVAMAAVVGASAQATQEPDRHVRVYFRDNPSVPDQVKSIAKALASDMFAGIGVRIDWRPGQPAASSPHGAIAVELVTETPGTFLPGALAYAQPYEGVHFQVFYDRISISQPRLSYWLTSWFTKLLTSSKGSRAIPTAGL